MHIPDGFLTSATWVPAWLLSMGGIGLQLEKSVANPQERMIPLMGGDVAFIFAAQMVNFPVMSGNIGASAGWCSGCGSARTLCGCHCPDLCT